MDSTQAERILNRQIHQIAQLQFQNTVLQDELEQAHEEIAQLRRSEQEQNAEPVPEPAGT
jgi:uncharacterized protein YlxW (UPF0749 family)